MNLEIFSHHIQKTNSKWIKDLNVRAETIKILEENTGSMLFDKGLSNIFLDLSPQARETKAKINFVAYLLCSSPWTKLCIPRKPCND